MALQPTLAHPGRGTPLQPCCEWTTGHSRDELRAAQPDDANVRKWHLCCVESDAEMSSCRLARTIAAAASMVFTEFCRSPQESPTKFLGVRRVYPVITPDRRGVTANDLTELLNLLDVESRSAGRDSAALIRCPQVIMKNVDRHPHLGQLSMTLESQRSIVETFGSGSPRH